MKKVAIVTGAAKGIGRAIAAKLAVEGYQVIGFYRSTADPMDGVDMFQADVSDEAQVQKGIAYVAETYGQIDVLVNNAGIDIPGSIEEYSLDDWNAVMAADVTSVFLMSKHAIPYLKKSRGVIINISSRMGVAEYSNPQFIAYGAAKAAVNNITTALAKELKDSGVRVNAVIPTPTKTDLLDKVFSMEDQAAMKNKGKLGAPDEAAELVFKTIIDQSKTGELVFDDRVFL